MLTTASACHLLPKDPSCEQQVAAFVLHAHRTHAIAALNPRHYMDAPFLDDPDVRPPPASRAATDFALVVTERDITIEGEWVGDNDEEGLRPEARQELARRMTDRTGQRVLLQAEPQVAAGVVADVLETLRNADLSEVDVVVRLPSQPRMHLFEPPTMEEVDAVFEDPACPVDYSEVARASVDDKDELEIEAWVTALRDCDCALDVGLLMRSFEDQHLPKVWVDTVPLRLVGPPPDDARDRTWEQVLVSGSRGWADLPSGQRVAWPPQSSSNQASEAIPSR